jgi:hypothetical protein
MRDFLFGNWEPRCLALGKQHPLQVLAAVLAMATLAIQLAFGRPGSSGGDTGGFDCGDGDGGSCGD